MECFTKPELIGKLAAKEKISNVHAARIIEEIFEFIRIEVEENNKSFHLPRITGVLTKQVLKARMSRNPKTGEQTRLPLRYKVKLKFPYKKM